MKSAVAEQPLAGKVAVVTGAGAGLGRAEALALARAGADVVVNDMAHSDVIDEIRSLGVRASLVKGDVGERSTADELIRTAVEEFGGLHVVVNNAGVTRDQMLFNMSDEDFDLVIRVHLRGHFLLTRNAGVYWREQSKSTGGPVYGSIVNTSSEAAFFGPAGQANYGAAKAGITTLTMTASKALGRYGVRANAICPRARTAMTESVFAAAPTDGPDPLSVENVAPLVAYLASPASAEIDGQVFVVYGGMVVLMAPPTIEQRFDSNGPMWTPEEIEKNLGGYFAGRDPQRTFVCADLANLA